MLVNVFLIPTGRRTSENTEVYEIEMDGEVIGEHRDPEFHTCRLLKKQGVTGKVAFFRRGWVVPHMVVDIDKGAELITRDNRKTLRIAKYVPYGGESDDRDARADVEAEV